MKSATVVAVPLPTDHLQPFHVFRAEATNVNELYWRTKYTYGRTASILEALAKAGTVLADPRVDSLWPSIDAGERTHLTIPLSQMRGSLEKNLEVLRRTSVLYLCSAFENTLCGFFVLCALYKPSKVIPQWPHGSCPALGAYPGRLLELKKKSAGSMHKLRGKYSDRLQSLNSTFSLDLNLSAIPTIALDLHYDVRHRIAHDQGLISHDDPTIDPQAVLAKMVTLSESEWKSMINDFFATVSEIDRAAKAAIVVDFGIALFVAQIVEEIRANKKSIRVGALKNLVAERWQLTVTSKDIEQALRDLGVNTSDRHQKFPRQLVR